MNIGIIGLGKMGCAIARNLLAAGHQVGVWNRTVERSEALRTEGALIAETPAQACRGEITITCLSDDAAVEEVVCGERGIAAELPAGGIHVSMSTISPTLAQRLAQLHQKADQRFIAAPVFGRPESAAAARLLIVAAGDAAAIARCQPVFDVIGQRTINAGADPSAALWVKLAGNFLLVSAVESLSEVIALLQRSGTDAQACLDLLTSTLFAAPSYQNYARLILQQQHEAGFRLGLALKDVALVRDAASSLNMTLPTAELLHDQLQNATSHGWREQDLSVLARLPRAKIQL